MAYKEKLERGRAWPIRTDQLLVALDAAGVSHPNAINRTAARQYPRSDTRVLEVAWREAPLFGATRSSPDGFTSVVIHNVLTEDRDAIEQALVNEAIPELLNGSAEP